MNSKEDIDSNNQTLCNQQTTSDKENSLNQNSVSMTDFEFDNIQNYLLTLVGCLFVPTYLGVLLFVADILFFLSLAFYFLLIFVSIRCFIQNSLYAFIFPRYQFSKTHFTFERVSFVVCILLAIIIMWIDYGLSINGQSNIIWHPILIVGKIVLLLYTFVIGFIFIAITYEKNRKVYWKELNHRRVLKKQKQIKSILNTRGFEGGIGESQFDLKHTKLSYALRYCTTSIFLILIPLIYLPFIFLRESIWSLPFFLLPPSIFIRNRFLQMYINQCQKSQGHNTINPYSWMQFYLFAMSSIGTIFIVFCAWLPNNTTMATTAWFFIVQILSATLTLVTSICFALSLKQAYKNCQQEKLVYKENKN